MNINQKVAVITAKLDELFPSPDIPLYHLDHFTMLVAVVLSAHTTDKSVNGVTPKLFTMGGTPEKLAAMDVDKIGKIIRSVGLWINKAKNIKALAQILVDKHGGEVPHTFEELEALPGVGHKTASVIMSQCFGLPAFPVDTHIHRLATRWGLTSGKNVAQTEMDLKKAFPQPQWNMLHLQMIYYGRQYCPAKGHDLDRCPICRELN